MHRQLHRGESQLFVIFGMLVMLVLGVVIDRVALLRVFPSALVQTSPLTDTTSQPPGTVQTRQPATYTPPANNAYTPPQPSYTGSLHATISKGVQIVSGPTVIGTGGTRIISGTIRNSSGKELIMVQITFATYDTAGNKIGEAFDNVNNLGANETWKFEALIGSIVVSYRLEDLSVW